MGEYVCGGRIIGYLNRDRDLYACMCLCVAAGTVP